MARVKKSTVQSAKKSKSKRKNHLAHARQCKASQERGRSTRIGPEHDPASVPSTSTASCSSVPSTSTRVQDSVLGGKTRTQFKHQSGGKTRTQFKHQSYESVRNLESASTSAFGDCVEESTSSKRGIVDFSCVDRFVKKLSCSQCKNETLCFRTDRKKPCGLAVHGYVYCYSCEQAVEGTEDFLAERGGGEMKDYTVNRQAVYSALVCGLGATTFNKFCESMDLQGLHHKTFHKKAGKLYNKLEDFERYFALTAEYVRQVHAQHTDTPLGPDDVLDISVSFDGTWLTRGHSSHIGVGCVVDLLTGLCLDAHVMCTYCQVCESTGKKLYAENPMEYPAWVVQHLETCDKNFTGSSGMMEVEAARVIWRRSVERYKLRYTVLLSDGDAKTYNELTAIKPYGDEVEIEKEECINHVSKRLGSALRNLVADCRKKGITLGGRGRGNLTQNAIRKLTIYYNRAIRKSSSAEEMKKAIKASLQHCYSTESKPQHELCPVGVDSWCFYQAALAQRQVPGHHDKLIHTPLNYSKLHQHLEPIYERLTDRLLSRCVAGKTQNSNECLHSLIWSRCTKDKFASRRRVMFAVYTAISEFNFGPSAAQDTASFFGFQRGTHMKRLGASRQQKRERNSVKFQRDKANKRRDTVRAARLKRQEELMMLEGGPAYAAGQF